VADGDFILPTNAPMGMRNNNPLNIKYYHGAPYAGLVGPSLNTDQGDPQMVFASPQQGWNAAHSLLSQKYNAGKTTPNQIIAGNGGWTPGNFAAAANVARAAGIGPNDDIRFTDPQRAQAFMRALVTQEQGGAARAYPDAMISAAVGGTPGTTLNSQPASPLVQQLHLAQTAPVSTTPGTASAGVTGSPVSVAATSAAGATGVLPGFIAPQASNQFLQGASTLDKAFGGKGAPGQPGQGAGAEPVRASPMIPGPQAVGVSPLMGQAMATYGQTLNSMRQPLQWGPNTPGSGSPFYAGAGPQTAASNQGLETQQLQQLQQLSNPMMLQMMGMGYG
jgi:hypothetical protein